MPYYVYRIFTDRNLNQVIKSFDDFQAGQSFENEMRLGRMPGDNYIVEMVYGESEAQAEERINTIRCENNLPIK